jgi:hypothetical protein
VFPHADIAEAVNPLVVGGSEEPFEGAVPEASGPDGTRDPDIGPEWWLEAAKRLCLIDAVRGSPHCSWHHAFGPLASFAADLRVFARCRLVGYALIKLGSRRRTSAPNRA